MTKETLDQIDTALRLLDRELWIVTAADGMRHSGLVATWVSVASIDPEAPVLVAGLAPNHFTTEIVQASRVFGAHLLRADQTELAWTFASCSGRDRDKFDRLEVEARETGAPIITDCLAAFDCRVFARYDAGDRLYFWADVVGTWRQPAKEALREQTFFHSLSAAQRQKLLADRDADAAINRPLHEMWRLAKAW